MVWTERGIRKKLCHEIRSEWQAERKKVSKHTYQWPPSVEEELPPLSSSLPLGKSRRQGFLRQEKEMGIVGTHFLSSHSVNSSCSPGVALVCSCAERRLTWLISCLGTKTFLASWMHHRWHHRPYVLKTFLTYLRSDMPHTLWWLKPRPGKKKEGG